MLLVLICGSVRTRIVLSVGLQLPLLPSIPVRMPPLQHLEIMLTISSKDCRMRRVWFEYKIWHLIGFCFPIL
ncbi:hypothetical protein NC651_009409 [Populus alba x Populus x berolinensis]|nr:hypothetical protein NC651_009409 [Populus alba x Populus x berolinensis]